MSVWKQLETVAEQERFIYTDTILCGVYVKAVAGSDRAVARVISDYVRIVLNAKSMVRR